MKAVLVAVALALAAGGAAAQAQEHKAAAVKTADAKRAHKTTGVVKKLDAKAGTASIAHDPVPSLKWPGMTMTFKAKDKSVLEKLAVDRRIEFEFEQQGKDYVITTAKAL